MMKHLIVLTFFLCFSAITTGYAQVKPSQKEKFQSYYNQTKALVQSKNYKFVGEVVYNNKQRRILEADSNSLTLNQNEVVGQISTLDVKRGSIEVKGETTNYNVNFDDDAQMISIEFSIEEKSFYIDIKPNGNVFLAYKSGVDNITQVGKILGN